jgi:hypothetical protein
VDIEATTDGRYATPVTIARSGTAQQPITFTWPGTTGVRPTIAPGMVTGGPVVTIKDAQYVTFSGIWVQHAGTDDGIDVTGSSHVTVEQLTDTHVSAASSSGSSPGQPGAGVSIDGTSSGITISRVGFTGAPGPALVAQQGSSGVTVTTSEFSGSAYPGITLDGTENAAITSSSFGVSCGAATVAPDVITIADSSSATVENNLIEGAGSTATCPGVVGLSVDASSAGSVTADYNAFHVTSAWGDYSWAGTAYQTVAAFRASNVGQGAHDLDLPAVQAPGGVPPEGSPLIDSADCGAPGELATDFAGRPRVDDPLVADSGNGTCHADRGANERQDTVSITDTTSPTAVSGLPAGAIPFTFGETITSATSNWGAPVTYTIDFGDGSAPVPATAGTLTPHVYTAEGQYTVTITGSTADGGDGQKYETAYALSAQPHHPSLSAAPYMLNGTYVPDTASFSGGYEGFDWEIAGTSLYAGDGSGSYAIHTYATPGTYTAAFAVTDLIGRLAVARATVTVGDKVQPTDSYVVYSHAVPAHGVVSVPIGTLTGSSSARSALLNLIVSNPKDSGHITVYPYGPDVSPPSLATMPFQAGKPAEDSVLAVPGINGPVSFYNGSAGPVNLQLIRYGSTIYHLYNSYTFSLNDPYGDTYTPVTPARVLPATTVAGAHHVAIQVPGHYGVPANADAVVLDISESGSAAAGHLATWSENDQGHTTLPGAYWAKGQAATSLATVAVNGRVIVSNASTAAASFSADVVGYYVKGGTGSVFVTATPRRLLTVTVASKHWVKLPAAGKNGIPATTSGGRTTAVAVNLTASGAKAPGTITGYADGTSRPGTTNLSYASSETIATAAIIQAGADGAIDLYNSGPDPVTLTIDLTCSYYAYS